MEKENMEIIDENDYEVEGYAFCREPFECAVDCPSLHGGSAMLSYDD